MTCPNCHAEVGEGKKFCGKCGAALRVTVAPPTGTIAPEHRCPKCGTEVQPGKKFCGRCGSALIRESPETQRQIPAPATAPTPVSPPPALSATVRVQPATPPIGEKPCRHCGAPVRAGAKFCKQCGKSPSEDVPRAATFSPAVGQAYDVPPATSVIRPPEGAPPRAARLSPALGQAYDVPPATAVSRPPETTRIHPLPTPAKKRTLVWVAGLSLLVLAGAAIGYFKIYKRAAPAQANIERPSPANSASSSATLALSTAVATPSTAPTGVQSASQASQATAAAPQTPVPSGSVGEPSPAPPTPEKPTPTPETPPPPPARPLYQQAHKKAEQAFAAERYIDPPDDNALSWARRAGRQGDPEAAQIEQQVLSRMARKVQEARAARNYDLSVALLTKLAALFPDHPELQQLVIAAQQEQQDYARQLQRQRQQQQR